MIHDGEKRWADRIPDIELFFRPNFAPAGRNTIFRLLIVSRNVSERRPGYSLYTYVHRSS